MSLEDYLEFSQITRIGRSLCPPRVGFDADDDRLFSTTIEETVATNLNAIVPRDIQIQQHTCMFLINKMILLRRRQL